MVEPGRGTAGDFPGAFGELRRSPAWRKKRKEEEKKEGLKHPASSSAQAVGEKKASRKTVFLAEKKKY